MDTVPQPNPCGANPTTVDILAARRQAQRERAAMRRALETTPQRSERRRRARLSASTSRDLEDTPRRSSRLHQAQNQMRQHRSNMNTPQRTESRESQRALRRLSRAAENTPQREHRRETNASRQAENRERRRGAPVSRRLFQDSTTGTHDYVHHGEMIIPCGHCGALHFLGERLRNSTTTSPKFSKCCQRGQIGIQTQAHFPDLLRHLLTGAENRSRHFLANIRMYNNLLSLASVTGKWVQRGQDNSSFNPTMTLQGRIYHHIGALLPPIGHVPSFLSLYIHDTDYVTQTEGRLRHAPHAERHLLTELTAMLHNCNTYVQSFLSVRESLNCGSLQDNHRLVIHSDRRPQGQHVRRYNGPSCSEVAAIITGNEDNDVGRRDIVVQRRGVVHQNGSPKLELISVTHRSYDPLSYIILFPTGCDGWYPELKFSSGGRDKRITPLMFYSWHLFQRTAIFNPVLYAKRLFQQYLVDQFCKVESERLSYIRMNQNKLRVAEYTSLREQLGDQVRQGNESDELRAGRLIVLPSTHIGGDRYMRQQMHDIMAISNKVGHPDIFLTVTCNPKWPEVVESLLPGQTPQDRPDLTARVFRLKLNSLMEYVIKKKLFGTVLAHVRVIEFQKRGLPHAHVIYWLDDRTKSSLRNPDNVDRFISAEIPGASDNKLRELVLKHMIHTPCSTTNNGQPCMRDGSCTKGFPKEFQEESGQSENDYYVVYRRRSPQHGGQTATRRIRNREMVLDNSWVVPHNKTLLLRFECHINVELCVSRVGGIKYLFKYVCKGSDRVTMGLQAIDAPVDEIRNFQDARYVSASEAVWRLFSFDIIDRRPAVIRLAVHLPHHQPVYFQQGEEIDAAMRDPPKTTLTVWFRANQKYPNAQHISYDDFPRYFTWNKSTKEWKPRASTRTRMTASTTTQLYDFSSPATNMIGRLYAVSPRAGEKYYLRMLLIHLPGNTSFEGLRTIDGHTCQTFREACVKLGLLSDDTEWERTLDESFRSSFVPLTYLFATILSYCHPSNPKSLFDSRKDNIISDFKARHPSSLWQYDEDCCEEYVLHELSEFLSHMTSTTLHGFGLPQPQQGLTLPVRHTVTTTPRISNTEFQLRVDSMNAGQRTAYNIIMQSVNSTINQRLFFLDAPGGTGKTYLLNTLIMTMDILGKSNIAVATSAVAAVLLEGGRTAHSTFCIPIDIASDSTCSINVRSEFAQKLKSVHIIIWDEIVMAHRYCIEAIDRTLRDITGVDQTFGGKVVVFAGDFRQILPVIPHGSRGQIVQACLKSSFIYSFCQTLRLTENMRISCLRQDPNVDHHLLTYPNYILKVGEGRIPICSERKDIILPDIMDVAESRFQLASQVYNDISCRYAEEGWLKSRCILTTKNMNLHALNCMVGDKIPGQYTTLLSADKVENVDVHGLSYPTEFLNQLTGSGALPDHKLRLKNGFIVMLLRNIDSTKGHCNGARYIVDGISSYLLSLRLETGVHAGERLALPRMHCSPGDSTYPVPGFIRTQFPIRVCFAITTNKAQGQSFANNVGLDVSDPCFSHGQLYVALSRCSNPRKLCVYGTSNKKTPNIVFPEVLSSS